MSTRGLLRRLMKTPTRDRPVLPSPPMSENHRGDSSYDLLPCSRPRGLLSLGRQSDPPPVRPRSAQSHTRNTSTNFLRLLRRMVG